MSSRFIADAMLGRLARRLRLLGYDTAYERGITDAALLARALKEGRIILTRDTKLVERKAALGQSFLILSNDPAGQLKEVFSHFSLEPSLSALPGRCSVCNGELEREPDKSAVRDLVPEHVFLNRKDFYRCSGCGRVYWEGSHAERFKKLLNDIIKNT